MCFFLHYYLGVVFDMENFEESKNTNDDEKVESSLIINFVLYLLYI